jgi:hypothetical protein
MASVRRELRVDTPAEKAWDAVRDFTAVHERLVPGVLTAGRPDGDSARVVTFASGAVVREVLVDRDDAARRLAYAVVDSPFGFQHHNASIDVVPDPDDPASSCRIVWVTDLLPDELAGPVGDLMDAGATAMTERLAP